MLELEEAWDYILGHCEPLAPQPCNPLEALHRVLAHDVRSTADLPAFDNSAMDGFAIRTIDCAVLPARLTITTSVMAGEKPLESLGPGEAVRIMTGAPVPPGADAVCPLESVEVEADCVIVDHPPGIGDHIRRRGEDVTSGTVVSTAGTEVGPAHVGLFEAIGCQAIACYPGTRVGVLSTGDELLTTTAGGIRDSNRATLLAALNSDHFSGIDLGVVPDDTATLGSTLREAAIACDAIVTTGGVSVGDRDVVRLALEGMSTQAHRWMQVAIKPAKPFAFAVLKAETKLVPLFGLPGNPVSALVSYELLARPGLARMAGRSQWWRPVVTALTSTSISRRPDGKRHFILARARRDRTGQTVVSPVIPQGSHMLSSAAHANALVILPDGIGVPAGTNVRTMVLDMETLRNGPGVRPFEDLETVRRLPDAPLPRIPASECPECDEI